MLQIPLNYTKFRSTPGTYQDLPGQKFCRKAVYRRTSFEMTDDFEDPQFDTYHDSTVTKTFNGVIN